MRQIGVESVLLEIHPNFLRPEGEWEECNVGRTAIRSEFAECTGCFDHALSVRKHGQNISSSLDMVGNSCIQVEELPVEIHSSTEMHELKCRSCL